MSEYIPPNLTLFENLAMQVAGESSEYVEIPPVNSIENSTVIEYRDLGQPGVYKALDRIFLLAEIQILKHDGKIYTDADLQQGYLANNSLSSLIKSASLSINNVSIINISETFAQRDYIESVINYDETTCKGRLAIQGLYPMENETVSLKEQTKNSKICQFYTKFNICNLNKWMLPNCDIYIKLELANSAFTLIEEDILPTGRTESKIVLKNLKLFIKYVKTSSALNLYMENQLASGRKAIYEFKNSLCLNFTIPNASTNFTFPSLYLGLKPSFAIMCFVKSSSFLGDSKSNPHVYEMHNLSSFNFILNGQTYPQTPYTFKIDDTEQKMAKMFMNFHKALNFESMNISCLVNFKNYAKQNFFIAEDFSSCSYALSDVLEPFTNISLGFSAVFAKPTEYPITALLYIMKNKRFEITSSRTVEVVY